MPKEISYMTFDRDTLDSIAVVWPKGHPKYPEGRQQTKRQQIDEALALTGKWSGRKDLAMLNICDGNNVVDQIIIEPRSSGKPIIPDLAALLLTNAELRQLRKANLRLLELENANNWPVGTLTGW